MSLIVHVMLGGPEHLLPLNWNEHSPDDAWIGVDRGALYLIGKGIRLNAALGDFDSVTEEEYKKITDNAEKVIRVQAEKDDTDAELAVEYAFEQMKAEKVVLYGGTGGRLDHLLSALLLPLQPRFEPYLEQLVIEDSQNFIEYFKPNSHTLLKKEAKDYASIVGLTPIKGMTLEGFKYSLTNYDAAYPRAFVSNEFLDEKATLSFGEGVVVVIQSCD